MERCEGEDLKRENVKREERGIHPIFTRFTFPRFIFPIRMEKIVNLLRDLLHLALRDADLFRALIHMLLMAVF